MPAPRIRPTFSIPLSPGPDEAMQLLRERFQGTDYEECTRSKGRCAYFFVDEKERKLWSPHLSIQVEPGPGASAQADPDSTDAGRGDPRVTGSLLRGRFGPHPEMWTLFIFLYAGVGFLAVIGLMLGFVQWQSDMSPWGFWGVWIGIPGLAVLYGISATGQKLSAHQMEALKDRVEELVKGLKV